MNASILDHGAISRLWSYVRFTAANDIALMTEVHYGTSVRIQIKALEMFKKGNAFYTIISNI